MNTLITTRREADVLQALRQQGSSTVAELATRLGVSEETVRRAVKPLAARGLLTRVHGAVMLPGHESEPPFQQRMLEHREAKLRIAAAAAALVQDGDSLILDTGSTTAHLAQALVDHARLFVVTNSIEIARTLASRNGNRVYMAGGEVRADDGAVFGASACAFLRQFHVHYAVLSIGAVHPGSGLMDFHLCEAEFARTAMDQAERTLVVADHSKFGHRASVRVCGLDEVDTLVCDEPPQAELAEALTAAGVTLRVAR